MTFYEFMSGLNLAVSVYSEQDGSGVVAKARPRYHGDSDCTGRVDVQCACPYLLKIHVSVDDTQLIAQVMSYDFPAVYDSDCVFNVQNKLSRVCFNLFVTQQFVNQ